MLGLAVERADAGGAVELVAGEDVEVAVEVGHVDAEVGGGLRAVEEDRHAARARHRGDLTGGVDRA